MFFLNNVVSLKSMKFDQVLYNQEINIASKINKLHVIEIVKKKPYTASKKDMRQLY